MTLHIPVGYSQVGYLLTNDDSAHTSEITMGINYPLAPVTGSELATALIAFIDDIIQDCTTNIHCSQVILTQGQATGPALSTSVDIGPHDGAATGDPMTPNVSYVYTKKCDLLGRPNKGRFYLPGVSEGKVDGGGVVNSTFLEDQTNHAATALIDLAAAATDPVLGMFVFHTDEDLDPTPVAQLLPQRMVATQRRRLRR